MPHARTNPESTFPVPKRKQSKEWEKLYINDSAEMGPEIALYAYTVEPG